MNCQKLAQKALKHVNTTIFNANAFAYVNGPCPGGWEDEVELKLTRPELLYLIHQEVGYDSLFKQYKEKEVDVNNKLGEIARDEAFEYPILATVNSIIPNELQDLSNTLEKLNPDNEDSIKSAEQLLSGVVDGEYTFSFDINAGDYNFAENAYESLNLTASEVLGLLYSKHDIPQVFSKFNIEKLNDEFVNLKAEEKGFAKNYDDIDYGGNSDALEYYLESWRFILEQIDAEEIDEEELEEWMGYFDDPDNFEMDIQEWHQ